MDATTTGAAAPDFWRSYIPDPHRPPHARRTFRRLLRPRPLLLGPGWQIALDRIALVVIGAVLLVYFPLDLLTSRTTTTGGDTGAHIYTPWYLRNYLLPEAKIAGWAPGWYAGFPILQFYFPLVALFQALASYVIPYQVAFKLGTVLGTFFLPVAGYLMFRLLRFQWPAPALGALATMPFLLMTSYSIYGGNIPSSLSGEYGFSLSLGLTLVFVGLLYRLATEPRGRPLLAASILALAVLSHLLPVIVAVLLTPVLLAWSWRTHGLRATLVRFATVFGVAFALTAIWAIPFLARLPYTTDMRWYPLKGWQPVFPAELWPFLAGTALATVAAWVRRDRRPLLFLAMSVIGLLFYFFLPSGSVWNGRFLPFYYLAAHLLTAYFVAAALPGVVRWFSVRRAGYLMLAAGLLATLVMGGWAWQEKDPSYIDNWIRDNYSGYESRADYPTFEELNARLEQLPPGRVMWEPNDDLVKFGTPIALMAIPYFSGQPTMEGINFESSMTTPFHFLVASEVAREPSNPIPGLPYHPMDLARGARHMELLDIRYFLSFTPEVREAARAAGLEEIDEVGEFTIFRVDSPGQVVIPANAPVPVEASGSRWVERNVSWFDNLDRLDTPLVRVPEQEWERIVTGEGPPDAAGTSIDAHVETEKITFTTGAVGQPHWVKTSYFPNWKVRGAHGPYLASPSTMMVVPTQQEVTLYYARTWTEWLGLALTLAGLAVLAVRPLRRRLAGWGNSGSARPGPEGENLRRRALHRRKKEVVAES